MMRSSQALSVLPMGNDQGVVATSQGRLLTVWRKGSDGVYRCVMDISNDPAAAG